MLPPLQFPNSLRKALRFEHMVPNCPMLHCKLNTSTKSKAMQHIIIPHLSSWCYLSTQHTNLKPSPYSGPNCSLQILWNSVLKGCHQNLKMLKCQHYRKICIVHYFEINVQSQNLLSLFQLKGLCGNYNDNQLDDFQTPSGGLSEVSARLFGDSWRLQSYCPESVDVVVSIQFYFKITSKLWWTRNSVLIL